MLMMIKHGEQNSERYIKSITNSSILQSPVCLEVDPTWIERNP